MKVKISLPELLQKSGDRKEISLKKEKLFEYSAIGIKPQKTDSLKQLKNHSIKEKI